MKSGPRVHPLARALAASLLVSSVGAYADEVAAPRASAEVPREAKASPRAEQIRALVEGTLDVAVEPQSLFDVALSDEPAIQVEIRRLQAVLQVSATSSPSPTAGTSGAPQGSASAQGPSPVEAKLAGWPARLELDRARLEFYSLARERRDALLAQHLARREASRPRESDTERQAREAEAERQRALEVARAARTEAERLVGEELARLLALKSSILAWRAEFAAERDGLEQRRGGVFTWQHRARDAKTHGGDPDGTYEALRLALRTALDELGSALEALSSGTSALASLAVDPLLVLPQVDSVDPTRERRLEVRRALEEARADERALREEHAAGLMEEVAALNRERLGLMPFLSSEKRDAITGLNADAWRQAKGEARLFALIIRYQRHVATSFLARLKDDGPASLSPLRTTAALLPWLFLAVVFFWARGRIPGMLQFADKRLYQIDRAERRTTPNPWRRAIKILTQIHRPLEWLLLIALSLWLLPESERGILEVELLTSIAAWLVGGALVVNVINALIANSGARRRDDPVGAMRLRSLRLVGRTVVAFALVLAVSARLVGEGTIHSWVLFAFGIAVLPICLVLVRWWRPTIFERLDRLRKKSVLESWILQNREGWKSFLAALLGAVDLLVNGAFKITRAWISQFDVARRVHAYLVRRELDRMDEAGNQLTLDPIPDTAQQALAPDKPLDEWLECPADELLARLTRRIDLKEGGVLALLAPQGMGKTSLLRQLVSRVGGRKISCTAAIREADLPMGTEASSLPLVVLDDAHALIKPIIGGLALFDRVVAHARAESATTTWVFALDSSLWPFLKRARDARPLFDEVLELEPWTESQIGTLLRQRCALAGLQPDYSGLLEKLPPGSDEIDRKEALHAKEVGYTRVLWDHARGNPALALEVWRASLGVDWAGTVRVRPLQEPDSSTLDRLPDSSLFVLRAVLQLAPAAADDIARATRLSLQQVLTAIRFGQAQGIFVVDQERVRISWTWLRPVMRLLERRHLLVLS